MFLGISNICWDAENDKKVYQYMKKNGYIGLEIAPTKIFPTTPYDKLKKAETWSKELKKEYGFKIASMQSIWYGRRENMFKSEEERKILCDYTKKAIKFAEVIGCKNLVFGCPRNRIILEDADTGIALKFFKELGDYAVRHNTVIGIEANPPIYNTNYINDTLSALELVRQVDSEGIRLNLDIGTMIQNEENLEELEGNIYLINHVHISEPFLKPIEERMMHYEIMKLLKNEHYEHFISIEMERTNLLTIEDKLQYVREVYKSVL